MREKLNLVYLALSEKYGEKHAGFTHTYSICKNLSFFCNVDLFFLNDKVGLIKREGNLSIHGLLFPNTKNIFKFKFLSYLKSYFYLKKFVSKANVIHERFHVNPIDLLFVNKKPYVLEVNDPAMLLHDKFFRLYKFLINLKFSKSNCLITQTNTLKKILSDYYNKDIYVVSNGVDTLKFRPDVTNDIRKLYNIDNNDILVVFVGAFMQWHGVLDIVKLAKLFTNVKFLMVGSGPEFNAVLEESKNVKNLIFVGSKPSEEVSKFLAAADITIAPFNTDKFDKINKYGFWWCPVKLFEYMSSGKPVVSYSYDEVGNIVKEGGLLAKPGDFQDFSEKLRVLIKNKELRLKLGKAARKLALKYDWRYRAQEVYKIYKNLRF